MEFGDIKVGQRVRLKLDGVDETGTIISYEGNNFLFKSDEYNIGLHSGGVIGDDGYYWCMYIHNSDSLTLLEGALESESQIKVERVIKLTINNQIIELSEDALLGLYGELLAALHI